jgi:hypothetical protein
MQLQDKQVIAYLKLLHGAYNLFIMFLWWYQALMGGRVRKTRKSGGLNPKAVRRHRKSGPVISYLAVAGYLWGAVLGYIDNGRLLKYPLHFITGSIIILVIITISIISRSITVRESFSRDLHVILGLVLLCLYGIQAFLGAGILF